MPLLLVAVILSPASTKTKYGIVLISILGFFATLQQLKMSIADHRLGYERLEEYRDFHVALQEFTSLIKENRPVTVLWCYDEYPFGVCAEALLPFATDDHQPILYTTNVLSANSPPEIKFQLHHKLKVDYLLSEQSIELPFVKELHATPYYHFYKVIGE